ncbi:hypothetical protein D1B31_01395 [Neobacillus notoginsengisoli]|uniref:Uncharacterized protein n=1 Tax=Neobacillus notoginsengisoli TaxID=1578198 RepID=A0A417Z0A4_9BACI|nr:hypothetical protein [Neobacillus notoginsengisoli]RHW43351.1 hypothetical protein D1B31_01395 [Neobacillus notoginsengisoli]
MRRKGIVGLLILILVLFLGFILLNQKPEPENKQTTNVEKKENKSDPNTLSFKKHQKQITFKKEKESKEIIADIHSYLDNITGFGKIESVNFTNLKEDMEWKKLKQNIKWLKTTGFGHSEIQNDMMSANAFIKLVDEQEDDMSLRYLHRVFHDLDIYINNTEFPVLYGTTFAYGSVAGRKQLLDYFEYTAHYKVIYSSD